MCFNCLLDYELAFGTAAFRLLLCRYRSVATGFKSVVFDRIFQRQLI